MILQRNCQVVYNININDMKILLYNILISLMMTLSSCSHTNKDSDVLKHGLIGNVKSYKEYSYEAIEKFGELQTGERKRKFQWEGDRYLIFDDKGNLTEKNVYYKSAGYLSNKNTYKYGEKGNLTEEDDYSPGGRLHRKLTYKYDEKGNMTEENSYYSDGNMASKTTYKYDEKGNITEENLYNSDGHQTGKWSFKYDKKRNMIEQNSLYSDGSLLTKWTYKYDERNNMIEENSYYSNGSLLQKLTYKYIFDNIGNWIEKTEYENDTPKYIIEREIEYH